MTNIQGKCESRYVSAAVTDGRLVECTLPDGHTGAHEETISGAMWARLEKGRGDKIFPVTLMPPDGHNATCFTQSMMSMLIHDSANGQHLTAPMFLPTTPMRIADNRNMGARLLLEESNADWLLFIDSDMGWEPDAAELLLAAADPVKRPIIGALCFGMRKEETDGAGGFRSVPFPTIYDFRASAEGELSPGFYPRYDYMPDAVVQAPATGAAFLMIHRSALEAIGPGWFDRAKLRPELETMGEDLSFCARAGAAGIPIFVHTGVRTIHLKPVWVGEDFYLGARALAREASDA